MVSQININRPISDALYNWIVSHAAVLAVNRQPTITTVTLKGTPTQQDFIDMIQKIRDKQYQLYQANLPAVSPEMESV